MKNTQIGKLINGCKNVIRDENNEKYINAPQATSHVGFAGSGAVRSEVAAAVFSENGETMDVKLCGHPLTLTRHSSVSGKTQWYSCELSEELASMFVSTDGNERIYSLIIYEDCTVEVQKFVRKNDRCQWRLSWHQYIDESFIEIL